MRRSGLAHAHAHVRVTYIHIHEFSATAALRKTRCVTCASLALVHHVFVLPLELLLVHQSVCLK